MNIQVTHNLIHEDRVLSLRADEVPHVVMVFNGLWAGLGEGEALLHLRRTAQSIPTIRGTEVLFLTFTAQTASRFFGLYEDDAQSVRLSFDDLGGIPDALHAEVHSGDAATPALIEGLAIQMLALGSRAASSTRRAAPSWFPRAIQFIHANLASSLSVDIVSRAAGISSSRLAHSFRAVTGRTFGEYLNQERVRAAAIALRTTQHSVADIAASVGFYDQSHFCRTFKALKRFTPMEYRRMRTASVNERQTDAAAAF